MQAVLVRGREVPVTSVRRKYQSPRQARHPQPADVVDHAVVAAVANTTTQSILSRPLDKAIVMAQSTWLKKRIAASAAQAGKLISEDVMVTPELARVILDECNRGNRGIRALRVARYAADMAAGKWRHIAQGISIANSGELNDGQHRLLAILRSKTPVMMRITFGEDRDTFAVIDTGGVRSGGDTLFVAGHKNSRALAAATRLLYVVTSGDPMGRHYLNNHQMLALAEQYEGLSESVLQGKRVAKETRTSLTPIAVAHYLIAKGSPSAPDNLSIFIDTLIEGTKKTMPIGTLRDAILKGTFTTSTTVGEHNIYICAATILAWNDWLNGKRGSVSRLSWDSQSAFPKPE